MHQGIACHDAHNLLWFPVHLVAAKSQSVPKQPYFECTHVWKVKIGGVGRPASVCGAAISGLDLLGGACAGGRAPERGGTATAAAGDPGPPQQLGPAAVIARVFPRAPM